LERDLRRPISKREHKAFAPPRLVQARRTILQSAKGYWPNWFLFGLLLAGGAIAIAFWFQVGIWPLPALYQTQTLAPEPGRHAWRADMLEQKEEHRAPRLAIQNLRAAINQPLPLGIVLTNGTGAETLVLSGFVEGTSFSAGTALSATRWSMPGRDLDKAFISAPENFDGIMQVTVTLYSSRQEIFETKEVRFEWSISHKGDKLPVQRSPAQHLAR
jgi:hypothetical protein